MAKAANKCTICGKSAPGGELLCPPCRAALKRASHLTVQDMPHYRAPVRRSRKAASPTLREDPARIVPASTTRTRGGGRGVAIVLALGGVVLAVGLAWFVRNPAAAPADAAVAVPAPRVNPAEGAAATAPATVPAAPQPEALAQPVLAPERAATARSTAAARARADALRAELNVPPPSLPAPEAPPPAPEPASPPAPPPRAPPAPDRWQQMGDALARCDREGGFSGFICDQRVRIESCDGYWGRVPQCPEPPENPR